MSTRSEQVLARRMKLLKHLSGATGDEASRPTVMPLDYTSADLFLYVTSKIERVSRVFSCRKEPDTVAWLDTLAAGDVFYDIGANVGAYSLIGASRVGPTGRVLAFEPSYATFAHLCDNIVLNEVADIVLPVPLPLGEATALGDMNYHKLVPGHARHVIGGETNGRGNQPLYRQPILVSRLDDLVDQFAFPPPRFMKIDVDGGEAAVLRGARRTLRDLHLQQLRIEVDAVNSEAVMEELTGAGFHLLERQDRFRDDGTPVPLWYGSFARP